ncbi:MAG: hypothetical protein J0L84_20570 [Verrucomicrobia bacterium]|nr:hypothetical protein [Verrucomicrobiota bacterium]
MTGSSTERGAAGHTAQELSAGGQYQALAEALASPDTEASGACPAVIARATSVPALCEAVHRHAEHVICSREWPVVLQAWRLAREGRVRELLELDAAWGRDVSQDGFPGASVQVGRRQLGKLRGLRHERVIRRYLDAIEAGQARGWHPVVYGVVLAVYHLPLHQGLMHFASRTLASLVSAAERRHRLPASECQALLDAVCSQLSGRLPRLPELAAGQSAIVPLA